MTAIGPGCSAVPGAVAVGRNVANTTANTIAFGDGATIYSRFSTNWCTPAGKSPQAEPGVIFSVNPTPTDTSFPSTTSLVANSTGNIFFPGVLINIIGGGGVTWTIPTAATLLARFPFLDTMATNNCMRFSIHNSSGAACTLAKTDTTFTFVNPSQGNPATWNLTNNRRRIFQLEKTGATNFTLTSCGEEL